MLFLKFNHYFVIKLILIQTFCCVQLAFLISSSSFNNNNNNKNNNFVLKSSSQSNIDNFEEKIFNIKNEDAKNTKNKFVSEFVAKVRGGIRQARKLATQFNLILIRRVFEDSNYFLFQYEYQSQLKSFKLQQEKNKDVQYDDNNEDYSIEGVEYNDKDVKCIESNNKTCPNNNKTKRIKKRFSLAKGNLRLKRRSLNNDELNKLKQEPSIEWIEQQLPLSRKKRDYIYSNDENFNSNIIQNENDNVNTFVNINSAENVGNDSIKFNDPMWSKLWYINAKEANFANSMRIKEAWKKGYTGKGVVVTILDDGLEWDHPDIIKNYDYRASLDINDSDNDPKPRYDRYNYNKHGTRCAGEIAAVADNNICSVGVAYNSRIGGIRMLDGEVTDLVEATALSYNRDYIDIYSASWGPDDDGKTVDGPGFLALKAIEDGIKYGRRGLGSIYVWASGNGGKDDDNCNCDGYTNSIYTISISSATQNGNIPWYSEACSSTIASTFSSGSYEEHQIITTDLRKSCTEAHTGTSASAPLAAGIIALTLEANPELSWRDIQHIIVETARPSNLTSTDWQLNGANRRVSHSFGYGMMDALAMIELAKNWATVPNQKKCVIETATNGYYQKPILIPKGDRLIIELFSTGCKGSKNEINYLEHVQAVISVQSNSRGTLVVHLRSPLGTNSTLLDRRMLDQSTESFNKWPFTTVHMWGEKPQGVWTLEINNNAKNTTYINLSLILYGTKERPQKRSTPSNENRNDDDNSNEHDDLWKSQHSNSNSNDNNSNKQQQSSNIKIMSGSSSSILNIVHDSKQSSPKNKQQHKTPTLTSNSNDDVNSFFADKLNDNSIKKFNNDETYEYKNPKTSNEFGMKSRNEEFDEIDEEEDDIEDHNEEEEQENNNNEYQSQSYVNHHINNVKNNKNSILSYDDEEENEEIEESEQEEASQIINHNANNENNENNEYGSNDETLIKSLNKPQYNHHQSKPQKHNLDNSIEQHHSSLSSKIDFLSTASSSSSSYLYSFIDKNIFLKLTLFFILNYYYYYYYNHL